MEHNWGTAQPLLKKIIHGSTELFTARLPRQIPNMVYGLNIRGGRSNYPLLQSALLILNVIVKPTLDGWCSCPH